MKGPRMDIRVKSWKQPPPDRRRRRRLIVLAVTVGAVLLFLVIPAVLVVLAMLPPPEYRPARLGYDERSVAAKRFYRQMMDFDDLAQSNIPFEFTFTAEQVNRYLASVDEIAALLPEGQAGRVQEMMDAAGLAGPAVAIRGGRITLMVQSGRFGNIVSADLRPRVKDSGQLVVPLRAVRVGWLPVPQGLVRGRLMKTKDKLLALQAAQRADRDVPGGLAEADLAAAAANYALRMVLAALDGQPVEPEGRYRGHRIRLTGIDAFAGQLTVRVVPVPKNRSQPADSQTSSQSAPSTSLSR